jgi:hypothetical protein
LLDRGFNDLSSWSIFLQLMSPFAC